MDINARQDAWLQEVAAAADSAALAALESRLFGPKGEVLGLVRSVTSLPKEERPAFGKAAIMRLSASTQPLTCHRRRAGGVGAACGQAQKCGC